MADANRDPSSDRERERKEEIVEEWAFPEEDVGTIHHFYRGELGRANVWRTRLDTTTNWAVATTGVLISVAFSSSSISHSVLLAGIPVILLFLYIEARRFRKYDLYRSRVRLLEENYYSTLFSSEKGESIPNWQSLVAKSLHTPTFQLRFSEALSARIRRTYIFLLAILTGVWGLKLIIHPTPAQRWTEVVRTCLATQDSSFPEPRMGLWERRWSPTALHEGIRMDRGPLRAGSVGKPLNMYSRPPGRDRRTHSVLGEPHHLGASLDRTLVLHLLAADAPAAPRGPPRSGKAMENLIRSAPP